MASYPGGIFSATTKNTNDVIQGAHVNNLQDEVTAVETGLLSGLQHALTISTGGLTVSTGSVNVGGPSSLTTLNVTGGSTLNTLSVSGGSTFAGAVTFSANVDMSSAAGLIVPACSLSHSSTQAISSNTWVGLNWDTEKWDNAGMHSTSANSSRITFAASTGLYHVVATVPFSSMAAGDGSARLMVNDSSCAGYASALHVSVGPFATAGISLTLSALVRAASTADYVTVQVYNLTSTGPILAESTVVTPNFGAFRVSR